MMISLPMYRALCYADVFSFPLTMEEMQRFAIRTWSVQTGVTVSQHIIHHKVMNKHSYYCLLGRQSLISQRIAHLPIIKEKLHHAFAAARIFSFMPTVSAVFVTGGLAVGNVKKKDDIDFLIVTKPGWLWTTRLMLVIWSKLLGRYTHKRARREDATPADANTWCLNMWLDETALAVPKTQRNLYTAHEVIQATCLVDKRHIADRFLAENGWVKKYLPMRKIQKRSFSFKKQKPGLVEYLAFLFQRKALGNTSSRYARAARFFPKETGTFVLGELHRRI
ncbi:MAG: hypothetical protein AAB612_00780 [Patescibacteria group bacterium]